MKKGAVYVASVVGAPLPLRPQDLLDPNIQALFVVYADMYRERVLNKIPFEVTLSPDETSVLLTDAQDRTWEILGITSGDPCYPSFRNWEALR